MTRNTYHLSCTIPKDIVEKLTTLSDEQERSKSHYVTKALNAFLKDLMSETDEGSRAFSLEQR